MGAKRTSVALLLCWALVVHLGVEGLFYGSLISASAGRAASNVAANLSAEQAAWLAKKRAEDPLKKKKKTAKFDTCPACIVASGFGPFSKPESPYSVPEPPSTSSGRIGVTRGDLHVKLPPVTVAWARAPPSGRARLSA